ncbi:hypothetical protein [Flavobacterium hungaricum]|uniref:DUF1269 domain-containing protein n=1 Tax=Flavobacterium hungaricum TaxID=2082725 RepID=A0ABR9TL02_9FLAO|nr:hypothetical protein [Flavobacterium hungaricum]MBE8726045.1 hypothetical protein [Flavobacterium hungaricum]
MKNQKLFIAHYQTQQQTEEAIKTLKKNGYDITKLSIIGMDCYTEQNVLGYHNIYDRMEKWSVTGLFAIGLSGLIFGTLLFFNLIVRLPYLRVPIIAACLIILILSIIPLIIAAFSKNTTIKYHTQIKARKFMLCANETVAEIDKMRVLLQIHIPKENSPGEKENQILLDNETLEFY